MKILVFILCTLSLNLANAGTKPVPKVSREIASDGFDIIFASGKGAHVKCTSYEAIGLLHKSLENEKVVSMSYNSKTVDFKLEAHSNGEYVNQVNGLSIDRGSGCTFVIEL